MDRNFFSRIEIMYPIRDKKIRRRLIRNLDTYLGDNAQAWELMADGSYQLTAPKSGEERRCAQSSLLKRHAETDQPIATKTVRPRTKNRIHTS